MNNIDNGAVQNNFVTWLVLGILQTLCCNQITGIITIVYSVLGNDNFINNRLDIAQSNFKKAKIATIIGIISGILIYAIVIALAILCIILEA